MIERVKDFFRAERIGAEDFATLLGVCCSREDEIDVGHAAARQWCLLAERDRVKDVLEGIIADSVRDSFLLGLYNHIEL